MAIREVATCHMRWVEILEIEFGTIPVAVKEYYGVKHYYKLQQGFEILDEGDPRVTKKTFEWRDVTIGGWNG